MRCRLVSLPLAFSVALMVAALGTIAQSQTPAGTWTQKAPMPAVRGEVAAAAVGDKLFALGGGVAGKAVARNEEYDPASDRWQERAPLPQPRDHLGVAAHDGKIYTFGGFTSSVHQGAGDVVFEYDPANDRWRTLAPMKAPRAAVGVAVLAGKIHVIPRQGRGAKQRRCRRRATTWLWSRWRAKSTSSADGWRVPPSAPASMTSMIRPRIRGRRLRRCRRRAAALPPRSTKE